MSGAAVQNKICGLCRVSCADRPRVKDRSGRYFCKACYDLAIERQQREQARIARITQPIEPARLAHIVVAAKPEVDQSSAAPPTPVAPENVVATTLPELEVFEIPGPVEPSPEPRESVENAGAQANAPDPIVVEAPLLPVPSADSAAADHAIDPVDSTGVDDIVLARRVFDFFDEAPADDRTPATNVQSAEPLPEEWWELAARLAQPTPESDRVVDEDMSAAASTEGDPAAPTWVDAPIDSLPALPEVDLSPREVKTSSTESAPAAVPPSDAPANLDADSASDQLEQLSEASAPAADDDGMFGDDEYGLLDSDSYSEPPVEVQDDVWPVNIAPAPPSPPPALRDAHREAVLTSRERSPRSMLIENEPPPSAFSACPHCRRPLPTGAIVCIACGYNLLSGDLAPEETRRPATRLRPRSGWVGPLLTGGGVTLLALAGGYLMYGTRIGFYTYAIAFLVSVPIWFTWALLDARDTEGVQVKIWLVPGYIFAWVFGQSRSRYLRCMTIAVVAIAAMFAALGHGWRERLRWHPPKSPQHTQPENRVETPRPQG